MYFQQYGGWLKKNSKKGEEKSEEEEEDEDLGTCRNCNLEGPVGLPCYDCEDMAMYFQQYGGWLKKNSMKGEEKLDKKDSKVKHNCYF